VKAFSATFERHTRGGNEIQDVTEELRKITGKSGVRTGQLTAMVIGSTASLSTLEFEPGLVKHDIAAALEKLAPADGPYEHENTWHDDNGHSHVRACLIGPSLSLPIVDGTIPLGTWQQAVLIDFDTRPRTRQIAVTVVGE
jgi:secondary thiamine-phosphate synthase enzyme